MQHAYLRYECADAFGLVASGGGSTPNCPPSNSTLAFLFGGGSRSSSSSSSSSSIVLATAGSHVVGHHLRRAEPCVKIGHRDDSTGGVGTGRALNGEEVVCVDVCVAPRRRRTGGEEGGGGGSSGDGGKGRGGGAGGGGGGAKVATGWSSGTVRVFEIRGTEIRDASRGVSGDANDLGLVNSLVEDDDDRGGGRNEEESFATREPLVLSGHGRSPVRCVSFDRGDGGGGDGGTRLGSGGSDGSVVIWDVVDETGLFRLLGHRGAVTDLQFVRPGGSGSSSPRGGGGTFFFDGLVTSSLDGYVKVWDLNGQCCVQTIANHRGEVWGMDCSSVRGGSSSSSEGRANSEDEGGEEDRWRLITGSGDGQVRVWSVREPGGPPPSGGGRGGHAGYEAKWGPEKEKADATANDAIHAPPSTSSPVVDRNHDDEEAFASYMGSLLPPPDVQASSSSDRVSSIKFHPAGTHCGASRRNGRIVEVHEVRSKRETDRRRIRRLRRRREKKGNRAAGRREPAEKGRKRGLLDDPSSSSSDDDGRPSSSSALVDPTDPESTKASDEFEYYGTVRASHKIKGFVFAPHREREGGVRIVCALATNAIEVHSLSRTVGKGSSNDERRFAVAERLTTLDMHGHPTGIRSVALSSDDVLASTVSKNSLKVWNVQGRSAIRSLPLAPPVPSKEGGQGGGGGGHRYGLCAAFLPGNGHVVVGTREGKILIVDVASGDVVHEEEKAHDGAVWSLDVRRPCPGQETISIVTGSADGTAKFWDVESSRDDGDDEDSDEGGGVGSGGDRPTLVQTRQLQMTDDVVAVRYSHSTDPSKRLVFVSTLDCTVKVFFDDTLKFYLSLYGHSLPALAVDSSSDDAILATGGADKTVKIWGLDFGDTHRTMHGHSDSITDLRFVRSTHCFFTASKDGTVRYWDGDRFECVSILAGHGSEVNCLAVSRTGGFVLSGGMDRQVRVWERTRDMVFLEEERERELERMFDEADERRAEEGGAAGILARRREEGDDDEEGGGDAAREDGPQSAAAVRRSVLSVSSGDRIMESIEIADREAKEIASFRRSRRGTSAEDERRAPNPLLMGMDPSRYVLWVLRSVRSAELEQSLLVLPLAHTERLVYYLIVNLRGGKGVELCSRVAVFLIKTHQNQIVANRSLAAPLRELKGLLKLRVGQIRDTVGFNLAALRAIAKVSNDRKNSRFPPPDGGGPEDVWAGLGLGSDVAAALEGKRGKAKRR